MPSPAKKPVRLKFRFSITGILSIALAVGGVTMLATSGANGTLALWNDAKVVDTSTEITSGSLTLLVNGSSSATISSTAWSSMLPGDRVRQSVQLSNTGTVAADVTVATTVPSGNAAAGDYELRISSGNCGTTNLSGANTIGATAATVGVWNAGAAKPACIEVFLKPTAAAASQNVTVPFNIVFTATQKLS